MPTDCSADRFEFAPVEGRAVVAGVRRRHHHLGCRGAAAGRHRPGDRLGPAVRGLLCRSPRGGAGRAQLADPGRPARVRPGAGLRGSGRPRHPAPRPGAGRDHAASSPPAAPAARRWPASRPSTGSSTRRPGRRRATTRSATTRPRSSGCSSSCSSTRTRCRPAEIVLDLDATDDPLHGAQEGRFFHGYYGCYCYLPLYVFCGDHLLAAKLRRSNIDASAGAVEEVERIVGQIRARWPQVRIVLRADCGFAREALMVWCEANGSTMCSAWPATRAWSARSPPSLPWPEAEAEQTGKPARCFKDFRYQTLDSWSRARRVVGKAEQLVDSGGEPSANPRFVVTSLSRRGLAGAALYEQLYCARGEMENRIKECQLDLFADRTSTRAMRSNQLRLWFAVDGLRAARGPAPDRAAGHPARPGHGRHDPPQAAQDRRPGAALGPPGHGRDGLRPPLAARLGDRPPRPRRGGADHDQTAHSRHYPHATLPEGGTGPCCPTPIPQPAEIRPPSRPRTPTCRRRWSR